MVQIKRKVTIKTKIAQEEHPVEVEVSKPTINHKQPEIEPDSVPPITEPESKSNTGKVIGVVAVAVAIFAGIYFWSINKSDDNKLIHSKEFTEQVEQTTNANTSENAPTNDNVSESSEKSYDGRIDSNLEDSPTVDAESNDAQADQQVAKPTEDNVVVPKQESKVYVTKPQSSKISGTSTPVGDDVIENARRVIRGDFGNGQERKDKLGSAYPEIQSKVNEMYRNGLVEDK